MYLHLQENNQFWGDVCQPERQNPGQRNVARVFAIKINKFDEFLYDL